MEISDSKLFYHLLQFIEINFKIPINSLLHSPSFMKSASTWNFEGNANPLKEAIYLDN